MIIVFDLVKNNTYNFKKQNHDSKTGVKTEEPFG